MWFIDSLPGMRGLRPVLSIVTVTLNDLEGLKRTSRSLPPAMPEAVEWHVQDGGSGDAVAAYLHAEARCAWTSERDRGVYDAMNRGTLATTGDWVLYLNGGDCLASTDVLETVVHRLNVARASSESLLLAGDATYVISSTRHRRRPAKGADYIWHGMPSLHQALVFPRALLPSPPYPDRYRIAGDYYLTATVLQAGALYERLPDFEVLFYVGGSSFRHPLSLLRETADIQRRVLGLSVPRRTASAAFRIANMVRLRASWHISTHGSLRRR